MSTSLFIQNWSFIYTNDGGLRETKMQIRGLKKKKNSKQGSCSSYSDLTLAKDSNKKDPYIFSYLAQI